MEAGAGEFRLVLSTLSSQRLTEDIMRSSISVLFYLIISCCDVVSIVKLSQWLDWLNLEDFSLYT